MHPSLSGSWLVQGVAPTQSTLELQLSIVSAAGLDS